MHASEAPLLAALRTTSDNLSPGAQRDLALYWARRKLEARPQDWT